MNELEDLLNTARRHEHQLVTSDVTGTVNKWLAVRITKAVGTMWCAYAFALLAIVSLPAAILSHNAVVMVSWISQTFLQLVLLSIIIVGQNVIQEASDKRAEADHETLQLLHQINMIQLDILNEVRSLVGEKS